MLGVDFLVRSHPTLFGQLERIVTLIGLDRPGREHRLSNFMLWQSAYAELVFTETLWPDFRVPELLECLAEYQRRERRFGKTGAQLHGGGAPDGL